MTLQGLISAQKCLLNPLVNYWCPRYTLHLYREKLHAEKRQQSGHNYHNYDNSSSSTAMISHKTYKNRINMTNNSIANNKKTILEGENLPPRPLSCHNSHNKDVISSARGSGTPLGRPASARPVSGNTSRPTSSRRPMSAALGSSLNSSRMSLRPTTALGTRNSNITIGIESPNSNVTMGGSPTNRRSRGSGLSSNCEKSSRMSSVASQRPSSAMVVSQRAKPSQRMLRSSRYTLCM